ncbi:MAG: hypothetical protein ACR2K5_11210 [Pseudolabrys sp.]
MSETLIAIIFFLCLTAASLGAMLLHARLPRRHRADDTHAVVRACANIFVVMTSLVLGLMVTSAKNAFEAVDKGVHAYATQLILLDRTMQQYGAETAPARAALLSYVKQAAARMAQSDPVLGSRTAEDLLKDVAGGLRALQPADPEHAALRLRAEQRFEQVYEMRWALVEQSEGTIPAPLIALLAAWLVLIFASFGFRAPRNPVVVASFVVSSALIAGALYLILDMDVPFDGTIQVSPAPLARAVAEMER